MKQREISLVKKVRWGRNLYEKKKYSSGETFADYCDNWLTVKSASVKRSSLARYERDVKNHIKPFFGDRKPWEIHSGDVDAFS